MSIVLIDNYDSFTYNLQQALTVLGADVVVFRNDAVTVAEIVALDPQGLVLSPGPGRPEDAGVSMAAIQRLAGQVPILGVCLGHQAIAAAYGGKIIRSEQVQHGKTSPIQHDGRGIYRGLPDPLVATRYHSLVVDPDSLPSCLEVTARTATGILMGLRHREMPAHAPLEGVQFHPESYLTRDGNLLLASFLGIRKMELSRP